jgi:ABC-type multidrug transport system permease subunit
MSEQIILYLLGLILSFAAGIFFFFRQSAAVSVREVGQIRVASPWSLLAIVLNLIAAGAMVFLGRMEIAILFLVVAALFSLPVLKEWISGRQARGE